MVAFLAFEVGVRLLPPDAVQYTIQTINPIGPDSTMSGTITDPATVARWRAAMTARPDGAIPVAILPDGKGSGCSYGSITFATYTLHLAWAAGRGRLAGAKLAQAAYQVSSGGILDWNTYHH